MNILVVSNYPEGFGGGEGRVAHELARVLSAHHQVTLVCSRTVLSGAALRGPLRLRKDRGLAICRFPCSFQGEWAVPLCRADTTRRLYRILDRLRPEVVHSHAWWGLGYLAQDWARSRRVPFVYTGHLLPTRLSAFALVPSWMGPAVRAVERLAAGYLRLFYDRCSAVVALNRPAMSAFRRFGYTGPLVEIHNGRDLRTLNACRFADIGEPRTTLCFVGIIGERKNQKFLVRMLEHLPDSYRLVLVGPFQSESYRRAFPRSSRLTLRGQMDQAGVRRQLEASHLLVSASLQEVQSLVVLEAMACGTPVVGLANETIDELVDERSGRRLPRGTTPQEFARAVRELCEGSGRESYPARCRAARERVREFSWDAVEGRTVAMYGQLTGEGSRECAESPGAAAFWLRVTRVATTLAYSAWRLTRSLHRARRRRKRRRDRRAGPGPGSRARAAGPGSRAVSADSRSYSPEGATAAAGERRGRGFKATVERMMPGTRLR